MSSFSSLFILYSALQLAHATILPPSLDPFYRPPSSYASTAPGTVLRQRDVVVTNFVLPPGLVETKQLLYRTQSINGSAIATVTTLFIPSGATKDRFISFQIAEDSANVNCAPSYNFLLGSIPTNPSASYEILILQAYLAAGYIVSSPDYEGPDAAFAAGRLEGMAVLDSMKAVRQVLGRNASVVGAGYSGGAIATGWAASLQRTYAPELDIRGWTIGGTPANLTGTLLYLDGTVFSGLLPPALAGLNSPSAYEAQLNPLLQQILTPYGRSQLSIAETNCGLTSVLAFPGQSILSYAFQILGPLLLYHPVFSSVINLQTMGVDAVTAPTAPVQLYHAVLDEVIPYSNASTLFRSWCDQGSTVHFTSYPSSGHLGTEIFGLVPAIQFAQSAFEKIVPRSCSSQIATSESLDVLALGSAAEPVLVSLANAVTT